MKVNLLYCELTFFQNINYYIMIDTLTEIQNSFTYSPQFENMWEFYMPDWLSNLAAYNISQFKVISTSLPFVSFENESHISGHKYYSGYKMPDNFSITFREDTNFSVTNYFKNWQSKIFNPIKGCFISGDEKKTRDGLFIYKTHKLRSSESSALGESLLNQLGYSGLVNKFVELNGSQKIVKSIGSNDIKINKLYKEVATKVFYFKNIRLLGISNIDSSYGSSDELKITVNFAVDTVLDSNDLKYLIDIGV